ncbi:MAG: ArsR family transcriptional regulator [Acidimicrobiia bacterium]
MLLNPQSEWSLTELAHRAGCSVATAQREVQRGEEAGVVRSRRIGSTRLVSAEPAGVLTPALTELLLRSLGPRHLIGHALDGVPGIERAFIFGSWAARYAGERGSAPVDVDVLVIGEPDRDALDDVLTQAERLLGRSVQPTIRSRGWWDRGEDAFRKEIAKRPLVEVYSADEARAA